VRTLTIALAALLFASPAVAGESLWAGVPLDALQAMDLEAPTLHALDSGWRAPIPGGGFVQVDIFDSVEEAREVFEFQRIARFQAQLPEVDIGGDVPAVGDRDFALLFIDRNVVVTISDPAGQATVRAGLIRGALNVGPEDGPGDGAQQPVEAAEVREVDGESIRWDSFGRRTVTPASE